MHLMKTISSSAKLSLAAMSTSLGVLAIYIASIIGTSRIALMFFASLMIWIPIKEKGGVLYGILTYFATALLSYFLVSDKLFVGTYVVFFGIFGFIQLGFDRLAKSKVISFLLKFFCCNLLIGLSFELGCLCFDLDITLSSFLSSFNIPLYALIIILEVVIIGYILLYSICTKVFDDELRKLIVKRN